MIRRGFRKNFAFSKTPFKNNEFLTLQSRVKNSLFIYNIFMSTNISPKAAPAEGVAELFRILGQPVRVQILLVIGQGEACVCHLEAYLGLRQAAISQHLMVLRDAGLVTSVRDGRNIFYRLVRPELLEVVRQAARLSGIPVEALEAAAAAPALACPCPHCNPEQAEGLDCSHIRVVR